MIEPTSQPEHNRFSFGQVLLLTLFFILLSFLLFSRVMLTSLNHDEYQFVAGAQLLVERGLLPYRDYPFLHMPYMVLFNALPILLTGYDFLAARVLTAICGILSAVILFWLIYRSTAGVSRLFRSGLSCVAVLLFVSNSAYLDANGRALNHALPNLLGLLALAVFFRSLNSRRAGLLLFAVGVLIGLAAGTRLTYALLIPAFAIAILARSSFDRSDIAWQSRFSINRLLRRWKMTPKSTSGTSHAPRNDDSILNTASAKKEWLRKLSAFASGNFIALLPVLLLALSAPRQFWFGNFVYIRLNTGYREAVAYGEAMTFTSKLAFFVENILSDPINALLYILAMAFFVVAILRHIRKKDEQPAASLSVLLLSFFMFISAFGPTPTWPQYFFAPLPYLVIALAWIINLAYQKHPYLGWGLAGLTLLLFAFNGSASQALLDLKGLQHPQNWVPLQVHQFSDEIKKHLPEGKVLTLAPIFSLEAGLDTYEQFAVGPMIWRSAHILSADKRREYGIIAYTDLDQYLESQPPDAILLGLEDRYDGFWKDNPGALENPFREYAQAHGYTPIELIPGFGEGDEVIWVK